MLPSNRDIRARLQLVGARLKQLEAYGNDRIRASALEALREEREILNLVLLNRRVEASKPVVNLRRWRSANGTLALVGKERGERRAIDAARHSSAS
jgi:hypothetical protein